MEKCLIAFYHEKMPVKNFGSNQISYMTFNIRQDTSHVKDCHIKANHFFFFFEREKKTL